ncbi:28S ribosomal protein S25, mitochondrial isoform X2 [Manis pentadactyla]|uniref:28S ribosomal protein S25, mitochondrial isoform X2 n=1 Tax=Manis pentadactyla TaxID=143292 RepID=UPI00255C587B|nr:28S ribosomal protein S25, mitochondrial isoform X2 [Manis pentadactyla]
MPMKGRFPIRRTLQYLGQGDVVFKDVVKVMTVNYNTHGKLGEGARKFVFFNIPQIQYKNPWVQIMMFKNMTPSPFLRFYLGETTTSPSLEGVACEDAMDCPSRLLRSFYSSQYLRVCGGLSVSQRGGPLVVSRLSVRVVGRQIPRQQLSQYVHRNSPTEPQCKAGGHQSF